MLRTEMVRGITSRGKYRKLMGLILEALRHLDLYSPPRVHNNSKNNNSNRIDYAAHVHPKDDGRVSVVGPKRADGRHTRHEAFAHGSHKFRRGWFVR
jgi:hypothetical protein